MFRYQVDDSVMIYNGDDGVYCFGRITDIDNSNRHPFGVTLSDGSHGWFAEDELVELIERP